MMLKNNLGTVMSTGKSKLSKHSDSLSLEGMFSFLEAEDSKGLMGAVKKHLSQQLNAAKMANIQEMENYKKAA